jgi:hypothetical protein
MKNHARRKHAGREINVPQVLWTVPIHFVDAGRGVPDQTFAPGLGPDVNAIYPLRDNDVKIKLEKMGPRRARKNTNTARNHMHEEAI